MAHGDGDGREAYFCSECDFQTTRPGPLASHKKFKHGIGLIKTPDLKQPAQPAPAWEPTEVPGLTTNDLGQVFLPHWKQVARLGQGQRTVKMLRPICDTCKAAWGWWLTCPHDPYVTVTPMTTTQPIYEDVEGQPGAKRIVKMDEVITWEPRPNRREVALSRRINAGRGVTRAQSEGCILPIELRSPAFPNGVAPACQYRGCYTQHGLKEYAVGVFCRRMEAQLVYFDQEGKPLEYDHPLDPESQKKRDQMLASAEIN